MSTQADPALRRAVGSNHLVEDAQAIAIEALSFMATDAARMMRFLDACGLTTATLRGAAAEPGFLAIVLEHFTADAALVESYAANAGRTPTDVMRAREILAGPQAWSHST